MDIRELIKISIDALRGSLVRTLLTMLGIVIGIASVIIIISLGEGATASVVDEISSFGANIMTVQPGRFVRGPGGGGSVETLTRDDAEALRKLDNVVAVSSTVSGSKQLVVNETSQGTSITGVEYPYMEVQDLTLSQGSYFQESQIESLSKVIILGDDVVEDLYGDDAEVVGETIRVDGKSFRIIGVLDSSSSVLVPISTAQKILFSQDHLNGISVLMSDTEFSDQVEADIQSTLMLRHDILDENNLDFSIRSSQDMIESISSVTGVLTAMLSGIASISLVVGGIGIMNIMLVTVTERTREIGLLKAIGAKKKDILMQFIIEAMVLTIIGGMIGMLLGIVITFVATKIIDIPFVVSLKSVVLAIGVSAGVGLLFGWYPAKRAAGLQPIDALRHE